MFGEYVKKVRLERDLSLREFCRQLGEDPSNWSKIERGVLLPPQDSAKLKKIAAVLGIAVGSNQWQELTDAASVGAGAIPDYIMQDAEVVRMLPAFFRTVGSVKPNQEEVGELLTALKKAHGR